MSERPDYTIRLACPIDLTDLCNMIARFAQTYPAPSFDYGKTVAVFHDMIESDDGVVFIADVDRPVGCLMGRTHEWLFSREKVAAELLWWVDPEYRGTTIARDLLRAFHIWAVSEGADILQMSMAMTEQSPLIDRLYKRQGFRQAESHYLKRLT
jgi:GNAT superfamily N-acetyltransferase